MVDQQPTWPEGEGLDVFPAPGLASGQEQHGERDGHHVETRAANSISRGRASTISGVLGTERIRRSSARLLHAEIPAGLCSATGQALGRAPTIADIRKATYPSDEDSRQLALQLRRSTTSISTPENLNTSLALEDSTSSSSALPSLGLIPLAGEEARISKEAIDASADAVADAALNGPATDASFENPLHLTSSGRYPNNYKFPPKRTWKESVEIGLRSFWSFFTTIKGFLITIYALNVVGWGGMIFLLLIGGGNQYMCWVQRPPGSGNWIRDCNDINAPRRIWIEIDAQVLTALFCVTGFGLVPWRFRDLYFLLCWRLRMHRASGKLALRRLASWHTSWFRLPGSDRLDPLHKVPPETDADLVACLPEPVSMAPDAPLTGYRATPTSMWKLDFVVWMQVMNTVFQAALCGFMWGESRYVRPAWSTATFVVLALLVVMAAGILQFVEGKRIKATEGIAVSMAESIMIRRKECIDVEKGKSEKHSLRIFHKPTATAP